MDSLSTELWAVYPLSYGQSVHWAMGGLSTELWAVYPLSCRRSIHWHMSGLSTELWTVCPLSYARSIHWAMGSLSTEPWAVYLLSFFIQKYRYLGSLGSFGNKQKLRIAGFFSYLCNLTNWRQFFMRLSCYWSWISSSHCQSICGLISFPDLLWTKPKARSGKVRKFVFLDWLLHLTPVQSPPWKLTRFSAANFLQTQVLTWRFPRLVKMKSR